MFTSAKRCFVGEPKKTARSAMSRPEPPSLQPEPQPGTASPLRADPLAGVPGRAEAEQALAATIARGLPGFAAVFIVDRIHLLNDCFGYVVGDRLLSAFHDRLRWHLAPDDRIFRWSGTSFVALLERRRAVGAVRAELGQMVSCSAEITVRLGDSALALATAASWAVFPLRGAASKEAMVRCIDHYIAVNLGR
jgi:GGDEF domain-containing protein